MVLPHSLYQTVSRNCLVNQNRLHSGPHASAKRGEKCSYCRFALQKHAFQTRRGYLPNSL